MQDRLLDRWLDRVLRPGRLVGLDAARALALVGMMATHLLALADDQGRPTWVSEVFSGRSSALFALLAGVSLGLMTGRAVPVRGRERLARSAGLLVRALLVVVLGLALGGEDSGIAVILVHYGVLFCLGLLFVGLGVRGLALAAAVVALAGPVAGRLLRPELPPRGFESPSFESLDAPAQLVSEVLVTGYYPVLSWLTYLLAGMALGRLDLGAVRDRTLAATGALAAVAAAAAVLVSDRLLRSAWVLEAIAPELVPDRSRATLDAASEQVHAAIDLGLYGQTPEGPWQWLLVVAPHSTTPFDLVHTTGTALAVVCALLLVQRWLPRAGRAALAVVAGAGAATLSAYTLHVLMRSPRLPPEAVEGFDGVMDLHLAAVLVPGALLAAAGLRGPLEAVVAHTSRAVERPVALLLGRGGPDTSSTPPADAA